MNGLTARQTDCLTFVRSFIGIHGIPPSMEEIGQGLNVVSKASVARLLSALEERGAIRRIPGRARTIELVDPSTMRAVLLNPEIYNLVRAYASSHRIRLDTAANELLRQALGAAA